MSFSPPGASRPGIAPAPTSGLKVLVVDDHVDGAESLGILLEVFGHEVRTSFDGQAALDQVIAWQPDLVLMDLSLPVMDGYEAARRVISHVADTPGFALPLLVALSGYSGEEERAKTALAGFQHHLVKPVPPDRLQSVLALARANRAVWTG